MRREYHDSAVVWDDPPFAIGMQRAEGALCPDGKRRNAFPATRDGVPDTFFSIPAFVYAKENGRSVRVYGYVTFSTMSGSSIATEDDPSTVMFRPYTYRRHYAAVS